MSNIGFDFGTTNSVISFYDRERQALDCFRSHAGGNSYIPTVVAYGGRTTKIGEAAKARPVGVCRLSCRMPRNRRNRVFP